MYVGMNKNFLLLYSGLKILLSKNNISVRGLDLAKQLQNTLVKHSNYIMDLSIIFHVFHFNIFLDN